MSANKVTLNELRSLVRQIIKENYDEYDEYQKEYDSEIDRRRDLDKYRIYEEIKGIFNGEELNLREYGLCSDDDDDEACGATLSVGQVNETGQWIIIPIYIGIGNMLNREEIDIILKKELNPRDYKKINIEYSKPSDDEILIQLKRTNKTRLGSIIYYAG